MKSSVYYIVAIAALFFFALLNAGCSDSPQNLAGEQAQNEELGANSLLFPDLDITKIDRIVISDKHETVTISRRGLVWYVDAPADYPAYQSQVHWLLTDLEEAQRGQKVKVLQADYSRLMLSDPSLDSAAADASTVKVELSSSSSGYKNTFILGKFDFPDDQQVVSVIGERATARRYFRLMNEHDAVFLSPSSLMRAVPMTRRWVHKGIVPIKAFKRISGHSKQGGDWAVYRDSRFGKLSGEGALKQYKRDADFLKNLSLFFENGYISDVVPRSAETELMQTDHQRTFSVEDFDGTIHDFEIGQQTSIPQAHDPAKLLTDGVLTLTGKPENEQDTYFAVAVRVQVPESLQTPETQIETFRNGERRVFLIESESMQLMMNLFEQAENPPVKQRIEK